MNYCQDGQYAKDLHYKTEMHINMNAGSHAFIADAARMRHSMAVKHKNISAKTEIRDMASAPPNVNKNFSILPKSYYNPTPNNFGEPAHNELYKKAGRSGVQKGGSKRA